MAHVMDVGILLHEVSMHIGRLHLEFVTVNDGPRLQARHGHALCHAGW